MRVEDFNMMERVNYSSTRKAVSEVRRAKNELVYASLYEHEWLERKREKDEELDQWIQDRQIIYLDEELSPYAKVFLGAGYIVFLYILGMIAASVCGFGG